MAPHVVGAAGIESFPRLDEGSNRANVLTSKPLEWIRIRRQLDADEEYGELADPNLRLSPGERLAKVVAIVDAFAALKPLIVHGTSTEWRRVADILALEPFERKAFKRAFNAYADNIYYANPDRANVYLLGGTPPSTKQTIQYLYRNDALDNIEQLRGELEYLISHTDTDISDALAFHVKASSAFAAYLDLAPKQDLIAARKILQDRSGARASR